MASKKKAPRKAKAAAKFVTFQAFGNVEMQVALTAKNRTLKSFISGNVPKQWNMDQFALRVNDRQVGMDYVLNDGDRISAAPNVAGGR